MCPLTFRGREQTKAVSSATSRLCAEEPFCEGRRALMGLSYRQQACMSLFPSQNSPKVESKGYKLQDSDHQSYQIITWNGWNRLGKLFSGRKEVLPSKKRGTMHRTLWAASLETEYRVSLGSQSMCTSVCRCHDYPHIQHANLAQLFAQSNPILLAYSFMRSSMHILKTVNC